MNRLCLGVTVWVVFLLGLIVGGSIMTDRYNKSTCPDFKDHCKDNIQFYCQLCEVKKACGNTTDLIYQDDYCALCPTCRRLEAQCTKSLNDQGIAGIFFLVFGTVFAASSIGVWLASLFC